MPQIGQITPETILVSWTLDKMKLFNNFYTWLEKAKNNNKNPTKINQHPLWKQTNKTHTHKRNKKKKLETHSKNY